MANIFRKKHGLDNGEGRWKLQSVPYTVYNFMRDPGWSTNVEK